MKHLVVILLMAVGEISASDISSLQASLEVTNNVDEGTADRQLRILLPTGICDKNSVNENYVLEVARLGSYQNETVQRFLIPDDTKVGGGIVNLAIKNAPPGKYSSRVCYSGVCSYPAKTLTEILSSTDLVTKLQTFPYDLSSINSLPSPQELQNGTNATEWKNNDLIKACSRNPCYADEKKLFYLGLYYSSKARMDVKFVPDDYLLTANIQLVNDATNEVKYRFKKRLHKDSGRKLLEVVETSLVQPGYYIVWIQLCIYRIDKTDLFACTVPYHVENFQVTGGSPEEDLIKNMDLGANPCIDFYQFACGGYRRHTPVSIEGYQHPAKAIAEHVKNSFLVPKMRERPFDYQTDTLSQVKRQMNNLYLSCLGDVSYAQPLADYMKKYFENSPILDPSVHYPNPDKVKTLEDIFKLGDGLPFTITPKYTYSSEVPDMEMQFPIFEQSGYHIPREFFQTYLDVQNLLKVDQLVSEGALQFLNLFARDFETHNTGQNPTRVNMTIAQLEQQYGNKLGLKDSFNRYYKTHFDLTGKPFTDATRIVFPDFDLANKTITFYLQRMQSIGGIKKMIDWLFFSRLIDMIRKTVPTSNPLSQYSEAFCAERISSMALYFTPLLNEEVSTWGRGLLSRKAIKEMINEILNQASLMIAEAKWLDKESTLKSLERLYTLRVIIAGAPREAQESVRAYDLFRRHGITIPSLDAQYFAQNWITLLEMQEQIEFLPFFIQREQEAKSNRRIFENLIMSKIFVPRVQMDFSDLQKLVVPIAIAASPLFYEDTEKWGLLNYARLSQMIGFVLTNAIIDGPENRIWTDTTREKYARRLECYYRQKNKFIYLGVQQKTDKTTEELVRQQFGFLLAYRATNVWFKNINDTSKMYVYEGDLVKTFYIASAQQFCLASTQEALIQLSKTNKPLLPFVVRNFVKNSKESSFANAFKCPTGSRMNPRKKCHLLPKEFSKLPEVESTSLQIWSGNTDQKSIVYGAITLLGLLWSLLATNAVEGMAELEIIRGLPYLGGNPTVAGLTSSYKKELSDSINETCLEGTRTLFCMSYILLVNEDSAVNSSWIQRMKDDFFQVYNFSSSAPEGVVTVVNAWVKNTTRGKISNIVSQSDFTKDTKLVFLSTYFVNASWQCKFTEITEKLKFHSTPESPGVEVKTFGGVQWMDYAQDDAAGVRYASIPLADQDEWMVIIFMPIQGADVTHEFIASYAARSKPKPMQRTLLDFRMPFLNLTLNSSMIPVMKWAGINMIFDPNHSELFPIGKDLYVSKVWQMTNMVVDQNGIQSYSASTMNINQQAVGVSGSEEPVKFYCDHPFHLTLYRSTMGAQMYFFANIREPPKQDSKEDAKIAE